MITGLNRDFPDSTTSWLKTVARSAIAGETVAKVASCVTFYRHEPIVGGL